MATLTSAWILVGNASNVATAVNPGGDVEISNTGATTIQDNAVTLVKMADNSVGTAELVDLNVTTAKLADNAVTLVKMADNSVGTAELVDLNVTTAKLADNAVTLVKMADNSVGSDEIIDNSITFSDIGAGAVGSSELDTNAVSDASKIAAGAVDTSELANNAVTVPKLDYLVVNITFGGPGGPGPGPFDWTSPANGTLSGGEILGYYPVWVSPAPDIVSGITLNGDGSVTITLTAAPNGPDSFNVVVLRP
jgi:hypothetical protein